MAKQPKEKKEKKCKAPYTSHLWVESISPGFQVCRRCGAGQKKPS